MKIAVFIGNDGHTASLYQAGTVRVFESDPAGWLAVRDIPFTLVGLTALEDIRARTLDMLRSLAGCRHFVAQAITGALRSYFDGMGIVMWRLAGDPAGFLSQIQQRVETQAERESVLNAPGRFILPGTQAGHYRLNLIDALQSDGGLTSKLVLLPFLRDRDFAQIDMVCDHLPKWFTRELAPLKLLLQVAPLPDGRCHAVIRTTHIDVLNPTE